MLKNIKFHISCSKGAYQTVPNDKELLKRIFLLSVEKGLVSVPYYNILIESSSSYTYLCLRHYHEDWRVLTQSNIRLGGYKLITLSRMFEILQNTEVKDSQCKSKEYCKLNIIK